MNTLRLLQCLVVIHLAGFTLMAGTTAVGFAAFRNLSKAMTGNKEALNFYLKKMLGLPKLLLLGGILLVLSGTGLLIITHAYGQLWFLVKMGLIAALVLNGFLFGGPQEQKIKKLLDAPEGHLPVQQHVVNLRTFYAIQLILLLVVVVLAVAKPG